MARTLYDFVVIGGGSAGYNAARTAADLGKKVAVLDGARQLGGLCILRGCMPSKTLLYAAEVLHRAQRGAAFGLKIGPARVDMKALHARKRRLIKDFADHRVQALTGGKFKLIRQKARFLDPHTVELADGQRLQSRRFLIATGSKISWPPVPGLRQIPCWTSDDILELDHVPRSVVVLGGGVVACELAQFLSRIGSRVTIIQRSPHLLGEHSPAASGVLQQALSDEGIEVIVGSKIESLRRHPRGISVRFQHRGRHHTRTARHCLNALGREAQLTGLNLAAIGVKTGPEGAVRINRWQQTTVPHIYAAGDCSGPVEIVHIAVQQGELAARHAAGVKRLQPIDYKLLLNVVFTEPALATIGLLERDLKSKKVPYLVASYPFNDHGKSMLMEANYGYVKVLAEPKRGRILGAEIVGPDAGELIHLFSGPLALKATVFDLLRVPWYHPTLAEIITYPLEEIASRIKQK